MATRGRRNAYSHERSTNHLRQTCRASDANRELRIRRGRFRPHLCEDLRMARDRFRRHLIELDRPSSMHSPPLSPLSRCDTRSNQRIGNTASATEKSKRLRRSRSRHLSSARRSCSYLRPAHVPWPHAPSRRARQASRSCCSLSASR